MAVEKVLDYSRAWITQETPYFCGPASSQTIILAATGKLIGESVLASKLGTHTGGTDYIGQFPTVLNTYMPAGKYVHRDMPNDPPNSTQRDRLWTDIVGSIDAKYGVVANIVSPPSNRPRASYKSTLSPNYGRGTIYHYVAVMGYAIDDAGVKHVWIADSGFDVTGYWITLTQLSTLIPPKGYAYATAKAKAPDAPKIPEPSTTLTYGIDIASWQKGIDLARAKREGISFAIVKTTEGTGYVNPEAKRQLDGAQAADMVVAQYHFLTTADPAAQARHIIANSRAGVPIAIDFEHNPQTGVLPSWATAQRVRDLIKSKFPSVGIYTNQSDWTKAGQPHLDGWDWFWKAQYAYNEGGTPATVYNRAPNWGWGAQGGKTPDIWQFTDKAAVAGMAVDGNAYRGSPAQLRALLYKTTSTKEIAMTDFDKINREYKSRVKDSTVMMTPLSMLRNVDAHTWIILQTQAKQQEQLNRIEKMLKEKS